MPSGCSCDPRDGPGLVAAKTHPLCVIPETGAHTGYERAAVDDAELRARCVSGNQLKGRALPKRRDRERRDQERSQRT